LEFVLGICLFGNISFYYFEDYKMKPKCIHCGKEIEEGSICEECEEEDSLDKERNYIA